jgi:hypothetical protein
MGHRDLLSLWPKRSQFLANVDSKHAAASAAPTAWFKQPSGKLWQICRDAALPGGSQERATVPIIEDLQIALHPHHTKVERNILHPASRPLAVPINTIDLCYFVKSLILLVGGAGFEPATLGV